MSPNSLSLACLYSTFNDWLSPAHPLGDAGMDVNKISIYSSETETILRRGSRFRVLGFGLGEQNLIVEVV